MFAHKHASTHPIFLRKWHIFCLVFNANPPKRLPTTLLCPIDVAFLHIYTPSTHPILPVNATRLSVLLPKRLPVIPFYNINGTCLHINTRPPILFSSEHFPPAFLHKPTWNGFLSSYFVQ